MWSKKFELTHTHTCICIIYHNAHVENTEDNFVLAKVIVYSQRSDNGCGERVYVLMGGRLVCTFVGS